MIVPTGERDRLAGAITGSLVATYGILTAASEALGIPWRRLSAACRDGYLEKLQAGELQRISATLWPEVRDALRAWVLP